MLSTMRTPHTELDVLATFWYAHRLAYLPVKVKTTKVLNDFMHYSNFRPISTSRTPNSELDVLSPWRYAPLVAYPPVKAQNLGCVVCR